MPRTIWLPICPPYFFPALPATDVDFLDGELAIARSMADAPEIDGTVQIQDGRDAGLQPGEFVDVRIMGSDEHDLYGEVEYAETGDTSPLALRVL